MKFFFFFCVLAVKMPGTSSNDRILYCKKCINKYTCPYEMYAHVRTAHSLNRLKCSDCDTECNGSLRLLRHWKTEHQESYYQKPKVYICPNCGVLFSRSVDLYRHKYRRHTRT